MPGKKNAAAKRAANQHLVDERHQRQWSQQTLANLIGTTSLNVSRWERGVTSPSPYFRQQLSALFGKSPYELGLLPEPPDPAALFAASKQTDPQTGPLSSELEQEEVPVSPQVEAQEITVQPSANKKETGSFNSAVEPIAGRPFWPPAIGRVPVRWSVLLSVGLIFVLVASVFFWFNDIPQIKSKASIPQTAHRGANALSLSLYGALPTAYGVHGQLVLDDPLTSAHTQGGWHISDPSQPFGCRFLPAGYDMVHDETNYCLADRTDFTNFVYQIDMTTIQGGMGGIVFRVNDDQDAYYNFQIGVDEHYKLYRSNPDPNGDDIIMAKGQSTAITPGYRHHNLLAVEAIGDNLFLYVNFHLITHVQEHTYTHGNVGVAVTVDYGQKKTEAIFRDAKVWAIGK
jgi:transcriptional regulator with XRE-family HTH domain